MTYPPFRWIVLLALCVVTITSAIIMIAPAPLMGIISKDLGLGLGPSTAAVMGVFTLVAALSSMVGGFICDRFGIVKAFFVSLTLLTIPTLVLPYAGHSSGAVTTVRVIQAMGIGPVLASVSVVAAFWFPARERSIVTGFQGMSFPLGIAVGFMTTPAAYTVTGTWQTAFAWQAIFCLIAFALTAALACGPRPPGRSGRTGSVATGGTNGDFSLALRQPVTWAGIFIMVCSSWIMSAFNDLTPAYFAINAPVGVGYGIVTAGRLMTVVQVAYMAGAVAAGFIFERVFRESARPVIILGYTIFAVSAVSIMWPVIYGNLPVLVLALAMSGFFQAWAVPTVLAFVSLHYPAHITGKLVGICFGIGLFGGTTGIFVGSYALHRTGAYKVSILIVALVAVIGFILALFLSRPRVFSRNDAKSHSSM